ncbi:MAG TPA: hypothetical protein VNZ52_05520 [Candidatus Thermoplasmatota archaeon]|nr:hypothetical protein [Candidatus Thermoplasmatota archaeon]
MGFSTSITCPTRDLSQIMKVLANAGFLVLDTGERISTDDGLFAEARLDILHLQEARGELAGATLA